MSGEAFLTITLWLASGRTSVGGGGVSAPAWASEPQPSSNGSTSLASNRTLGLKVAPRPLRHAAAGSLVSMRHRLARLLEHNKNKPSDHWRGRRPAPSLR